MWKCEEVKGLCWPNRRKWEDQEVESRQPLLLWGKSSQKDQDREHISPVLVLQSLCSARCSITPRHWGTILPIFSTFQEKMPQRPQVHCTSAWNELTWWLNDAWSKKTTDLLFGFLFVTLYLGNLKKEEGVESRFLLIDLNAENQLSSLTRRSPPKEEKPRQRLEMFFSKLCWWFDLTKKKKDQGFKHPRKNYLPYWGIHLFILFFKYSYNNRRRNTDQ